MTRASAAAASLWMLLSAVTAAEAHRSGCHRWHSCPSDHGTYVCGDLGKCSACPDNDFCEAGQPRQASNQEPAAKGVAPTSNRPYSGERCIYHMPDGQYYGRTSPERCY